MPKFELSCDDALNFSKNMRKVDFTFTSPPYANKFERYSGLGTKNLKMSDWAKWLEEITENLCKNTNGYVGLVIDSYRVGGVYYPAVEEFTLLLHKNPNIVLKTPYIWHKNSPPGGKNYPGHTYEKIIFCHSSSITPVLDLANFGETAKFDSGGAFRQRNNKGKRTINTTNYKAGDAVRPRNLVYFTVGGNSMGRVINGKVDKIDDKLACKGEAPFPYKLASYFIKGFSKFGNTICDPFMGTGTTALASLDNGCDFIGCDLRQTQVDLSEHRILNAGYK